MLRVHMCIEHTSSPFERWTMMGTAVGSIFLTGALVMRKWLVAPELGMAYCLMVLASVSIVLRRIKVARV
jgi:hypothetical protein